MRVCKLQRHTRILAGSPTETTSTPNYNGFNNEEDW